MLEQKTPEAEYTISVSKLRKIFVAKSRFRSTCGRICGYLQIFAIVATFAYPTCRERTGTGKFRALLLPLREDLSLDEPQAHRQSILSACASK